MNDERTTVFVMDVDVRDQHKLPGAEFRTRITRAVADVVAERLRQEVKWGEQNHPMVPPDIESEARAHDAAPEFFACHVLGIDDAKAARDECNREHRAGRGTYTHILIEEVSEFIEACVKHGENSDEARAEMVQVAAVALAMLEAIDRKRAKVTP